ncbi:unnamed protein product [Aphanomyces euteiches]
MATEPIISPSSMSTTVYTDTIEIHVKQFNVQATAKATPSPPVNRPWNVAIVYAAFIVFGLGSWIMTNCVFVETAALFQHVPERAAISAYLIVALQAANLFPTLYMIFNSEQQWFSIRSAIWVLLGLGNHADGHVRADMPPALLGLVFFGGAVSATTTVVYYPFVSSFPPVFTR